MTPNQIEITELIKQINKLSEKISSLIKSDFKNFYAYSLTLATSFYDEEGKANVYSIVSGNPFEILDVQTQIMTKNENYFNLISWALDEAKEIKNN